MGRKMMHLLYFNNWLLGGFMFLCQNNQEFNRVLDLDGLKLEGEPLEFRG
jgi:hypothetical protein